jgi:hypothetical protein
LLTTPMLQATCRDEHPARTTLCIKVTFPVVLGNNLSEFGRHVLPNAAILSSMVNATTNTTTKAKNIT